jgi:AAA15 family ATPase/GTPase
MLTSLEIENFKGIAARQRIDFAPLTLLFGANVSPL